MPKLVVEGDAMPKLVVEVPKPLREALSRSAGRAGESLGRHLVRCLELGLLDVNRIPEQRGAEALGVALEAQEPPDNRVTATRPQT